MSKVEENKSGDDESISFKKYTFEDIKEMDIKMIFEHIECLYKIIKRKTKKYRRCQNKFKDLEQKYKRFERQEQKSDKVLADGTNVDGIADKVTADEVAPNEEGIKANVNEESMTESTAFDFVNEMRQVAEHAQNINDFIYEPTSGLYYDQKSGYYYNAEYGLYYDGNTGCYYSYNAQRKSFEFHSQVQVQATSTGGMDDEVEFDEFGGVITDPEKLQQIKEEKELQKQKAKDKYKKGKENESKDVKKSKRKRHKDQNDKTAEENTCDSDIENDQKKRGCQDVEEGELSDSSSDTDSDTSSEKSHKQVVEFKRGSRFQDLARNYPPSLRMIVQESNLEQLKVGSLSIITYKGGSLGREANNDVVIPDVNVSKCHLKFTYDHKKGSYQCIDMGSRNGTILNGVRMSVSQLESGSFEIVHGSVMQIGSTKLLCHVHEGNRTCGQCEPGLLIEQEKTGKPIKTEIVSLTHKEQLKKLQKKYGLENEKFVEGNKGANNAYNDRAATRRTVVGSYSDKEKTQSASVDTAISSENKGFKMLSKLGWNKGEGLGKTTGALLEPINVTSNEGKKGLGCEEPSVGVSFTMADKRKLESLKKTQERYQKADIFLDDSSSN